MVAVKLNNLSKFYGDNNNVIAVNDVSLTVEEGELFGLIGPDGAGKTSIFRMLTTLLLPDKGSATVGGFDIVKDYKKIRSTVGYMPGKFSLYQDLSVEENLNFFATVFGTTVEENYELIKDIYTQIEPFKTRRAGKLSGGMKQKLALCCALIHKPTVLFLDEPTTGVDPVSRKEFWEMLRKLKEQKITMIVSTPYMDEATLCDRIALIQEGRILSVNTPDHIRDGFPDALFGIKANGRMYQLLQALHGCEKVMNCYAFGEYAHVVLRQKTDVAGLQDYLREQGTQDAIAEPLTPTIEDCFIKFLTTSDATDRH